MFGSIILCRDEMKTPEGAGSPAKWAEKTFKFPSNDRKLESIKLEGNTLVAKIDGKEERIACGSGKWTKGKFALGPLAEQPAAASGAWTGDDTYTARICFYETPFTVTLRMKYEGDELALEAESNVGFGSTRSPKLVGKAE